VTYAGEELRVDALAERIDTVERTIDQTWHTEQFSEQSGLRTLLTAISVSKTDR